MFITSVFHPLLSLLVHAALVTLFAISVHNQAGPDMSDPAHPQPGAPWYITKKCGPPVSSDLIGYCKQSKAAFSVTVLMVYVYPYKSGSTCSDANFTLARSSPHK